MFTRMLFAVALGTASATAFSANGGQDPAQLRLTPAEYAKVAPANATAGTSGVAGIETRVVKGAPSHAGVYTIVLTVPANTRIAAHHHPDDRVATVISGIWHFGYGERFDEGELEALPPGSFYTEPPGQPHFARTGHTAVVLQITGFGPTGTTYVEPPVDEQPDRP